MDFELDVDFKEIGNNKNIINIIKPYIEVQEHNSSYHELGPNIYSIHDGGNKKFYPKMINHEWHKPELKPSSQS